MVILSLLTFFLFQVRSLEMSPGHSGRPQDQDQLLYGSLSILGLDIAALEHNFKAPIVQVCEWLICWSEVQILTITFPKLSLSVALIHDKYWHRIVIFFLWVFSLDYMCSLIIIFQLLQKSFSRIDKRLGDAILHFLFVCLDREKAAKVFRDCWPLLDKKHESQFHKATFEWYKSLQQVKRMWFVVVV